MQAELKAELEAMRAKWVTVVPPGLGSPTTPLKGARVADDLQTAAGLPSAAPASMHFGVAERALGPAGPSMRWGQPESWNQASAECSRVRAPCREQEVQTVTSLPHSQRDILWTASGLNPVLEDEGETTSQEGFDNVHNTVEDIDFLMDETKGRMMMPNVGKPNKTQKRNQMRRKHRKLGTTLCGEVSSTTSSASSTSPTAAPVALEALGTLGSRLTSWQALLRGLS